MQLQQPETRLAVPPSSQLRYAQSKCSSFNTKRMKFFSHRAVIKITSHIPFTTPPSLLASSISSQVTEFKIKAWHTKRYIRNFPLKYPWDFITEVKTTESVIQPRAFLPRHCRGGLDWSHRACKKCLQNRSSPWCPSWQLPHSTLSNLHPLGHELLHTSPHAPERPTAAFTVKGRGHWKAFSYSCFGALGGFSVCSEDWVGIPMSWW